MVLFKKKLHIDHGRAFISTATCACAEFITARSAGGIKDSKQDTITSTLTKVISDLLLDTCGKCEDYTTKIIYSNKSDDSNGLINFPVSKTSYGQSEYSKFVPVITVPGVLVITRKSDLSKVLTQVASGSALSSWPIAVVTVVMATLAGIIIWFLVGIRKCLKNYFRTTQGRGHGVLRPQEWRM